MVVAAIGATSFIHLVVDGFIIVKWLGVTYLCYLGVMQIRAVFSMRVVPAQITASGTFSRGFIVSLTNPKTILFFSAFLPQFISSDGDDYFQQVAFLSLTFLVLAVILDSCYAILASRLSVLLERHYLSRLQNGLSGILLLGASAWLALTRRS